MSEGKSLNKELLYYLNIYSKKEQAIFKLKLLALSCSEETWIQELLITLENSGYYTMTEDI